MGFYKQYNLITLTFIVISVCVMSEPTKLDLVKLNGKD